MDSLGRKTKLIKPLVRPIEKKEKKNVQSNHYKE